MIVFKNCGAKCAGKRAGEKGSYIGDPRGRSAVLVSLVLYDTVKEKSITDAATRLGQDCPLRLLSLPLCSWPSGKDALRLRFRYDEINRVRLA